MRAIRSHSLAQEILLRCKDTGVALGDILIDPPRTMRQAMQRPDRPHYAKKRVRDTIYRLQKRGLVRKVVKKHGVYLMIAERGKIEMARIAIQQKQKEKWDGKWRLIIYDVSEARRADRDFLRFQLKWIGFLELQKSVWVCPYDITHEVQNFIQLCRVYLLGDVRFLVVEQLDSDRDLRRYFKL